MSIDAIKVVDELERTILLWRRLEITDVDFIDCLEIALESFTDAPRDKDDL
jgi:hypothetical protein